MRALILLVVMASCFQSFSQQPFENSFFANTYYILYFDSTANLYRDGTAFGIHYKGKDYLTTVRHFFPNLGESQKTVRLQTLKNDSLITFAAKVAFHPDESIDVAIIEPESFTFNKNVFEIRGVVNVGSDCFTIGFPHGTFNKEKLEGNGGYPTGLLRKGVISSSGHFGNLSSPFHEGRLVLFDIISDPGFSGSPLIVESKNSTRRKKRYSIVGVVTGSLNQRNEFGYNGKKYFVEVNNGTARSFDISYAVEILDRLERPYLAYDGIGKSTGVSGISQSDIQYL